MNRKMRKETKIGILLLAIFNVINLITNEIGTEIVALHFLLGGLAGLALAEFIIGLLPETAYTGLKNWKKSFIPFKR